MSTEIPEPFVQTPVLPAEGWNQQPVGTVEVSIGVVRLRLFCWPHNCVHTLAAEQVEQLVYTLGVMAVDQRSAHLAYQLLGLADDDYLATPDCPLTVLRLGHDAEAYAEHVEQGVDARAESQEFVCGDPHTDPGWCPLCSTDRGPAAAEPEVAK